MKRLALLLALACKNEPRPPSFQREVLPVLVHHCAGAEGCHGPTPTDSVKLDLRPDAAHSQLVGVRAEARATLRVAPGNPDASFLIDKLRGPLGRGEGKRMPIDDDTGAPLEPSPLPPEWIERTVIPWIAAGARND